MPENGLFSLVLKSIVFQMKNMQSLHCYYSEFIHITYQCYEGMSYKSDAVRTYQWFLSGKWKLDITKCTKILIHKWYLSQWRASFVHNNRFIYDYFVQWKFHLDICIFCTGRTKKTQWFLQWNNSLRHGSPTYGPPGYVMWPIGILVNCAYNTNILQ